MPSRKLGKRWQLLTREYEQRARETAPKTPGKGGERPIMHQIAMKLAEMMIRPDIYGTELAKQMATQLGAPISEIIDFQGRLIARAKRSDPKKKSTASNVPGAKTPTPKQIHALFEEAGKRIEESILPARAHRGKAVQKRHQSKAAKLRAVKSASQPLKPALPRNRKSSKTSARTKGNTFRDRTSGYNYNAAKH